MTIELSEYVIDAIAEAVVKKMQEQEPKIDRLYRWLNDMRLGIAPDETTLPDERPERLAQVDVIDAIMEWLESEGKE